MWTFYLKPHHYNIYTIMSFLVVTPLLLSVSHKTLLCNFNTLTRAHAHTHTHMPTHTHTRALTHTHTVNWTKNCPNLTLHAWACRALF